MLTIRQISTKYNLSYDQVAKKLRALEQKGRIKSVRKGLGAPKCYDAELIDTIFNYIATLGKYGYLDTVPREQLEEEVRTMTLEEMADKHGASKNKMVRHLKELGIKKPRVVRKRTKPENKKVNRCFEGNVVISEETIKKAKQALDKQFENPLLKVSISAGVLVDRMGTVI